MPAIPTLARESAATRAARRMCMVFGTGAQRLRRTAPHDKGDPTGYNSPCRAFPYLWTGLLMKRLAVVCVVVLAIALLYRSLGGEETATGTLTLAPPEPNIGSTARTFTATDTEGNGFELTDEGVYVLAFWSPLNQSSNKARPGFLKVASEYNEEARFAVVYVNGARGDVDAPYDRLHDPKGRLASRYNVKRVPRLFVVRDGVVTWALDVYYEGYEEDLEQKVEEAITAKEGQSQTALRKDP